MERSLYLGIFDSPVSKDGKSTFLGLPRPSFPVRERDRRRSRGLSAVGARTTGVFARGSADTTVAGGPSTCHPLPTDAEASGPWTPLWSATKIYSPPTTATTVNRSTSGLDPYPRHRLERHGTPRIDEKDPLQSSPSRIGNPGVYGIRPPHLDRHGLPRSVGRETHHRAERTHSRG